MFKQRIYLALVAAVLGALAVTRIELLKKPLTVENDPAYHDVGTAEADSSGMDDPVPLDRQLIRTTPHFRFYRIGSDRSSLLVDSLVARREEVFEKLGEMLELDVRRKSRIPYTIYPDVETKALATGSMTLAHADQEGVHVVVDDNLRGDGWAAEAKFLIDRHLPPAAYQFLDIGLTRRFASSWHRHSHEYWAARLYEAGQLIPLERLLDDDYVSRASPLIIEPLAVTFLETLIEAWGPEDLLARYAAWSPDTAELTTLEGIWHSHLDSLAEAYRPTVARDRSSFPVTDAYRKGFNYAHEGYDIVDGYGSAASDRSLQHLQSLGTNAVAILPYSFMRSATKPQPLSLRSRPGGENTSSVLHALQTARELGMSVMLKPQLWLRDSWTGAIEMSTPGDWDDFFRYYGRWIGHYAILAEMYEIPTFCVGVELGGTTASHESEWRDLIAQVRMIYSGELVYAANWHEEFQAVPFWDALDFIGIDWYFPLSEKDNPTDAELRQGAKRALEQIRAVRETYEKPVLLTEVGFPSTTASWKQPHAHQRESMLSFTDQARSYRAIFEVINGASWIEGIYWWKWPSYLSYDERDRRGFTPQGKPAAQIVTDWWGGRVLQ